MRDRKITICSDSVSSLLSIKNRTAKTHQDILYEKLLKTSRLTQQGREITFMWVPAHLGIQGNEKADKSAKEAVKKEEVEMKVKLLKAEGKSLIWKEINMQWSQHWKEQEKGRHLYKLQSVVGEIRCKGDNRTEQVIMSRLRIGHSKLNNTLNIIGKHPTEREREEMRIGLRKEGMGGIISVGLV